MRTSLIAALLAPLAAHARTTLDFTADWRFVLGDEPNWPAAACPVAYDLNVTVRCDGLSSLGSTPSAAACLSSACAAGLPLYQWCAPGNCSSGDAGACWAGTLQDCAAGNGTGAGWVSAAATQPIPPGPAPMPPPACPGDRACAAYDDASWRTVRVPHDYVVEGAPVPTADRNHGYLPFNYSWYRKHFAVDASWASQPVWLEFDGVYRASDYWLNGVWIGHWESGYAPFRWYIHNTSAPLHLGGADNVLAVRVDGVSHQEGWFYEGSGIYREVSLNTAPALNLVPWGVYAPAVVTGAISSPQGLAGPQSAASAVINAAVDVQNSGTAPDAFSVAVRVLDAGGAVLASGSASGGALAPGGWARAAITLTLANVTLWSVSTPALLTVATTLTAASGSVDAANVTIGVRSAIFDANAGLVLNGIPMQIQGFSQHQDFGGLGTAVPRRVQQYRVQSLKGIGATGWRTAHNPVNSDLLALTDELGMLVMAENRNLERQVIGGTRGGARVARVGARPDPQNINMSAFPDPQYLLEASQMVLRDRNHPSIIMWSLCNEGGCMQGREEGGVAASAFKNTILNIDSSRPITANSEDYPGDTLTRITDIEAFSYNYDEYDAAHRKFPWKPVMGGESASCVSDRGYYGQLNVSAGTVPADDIGCVVSAWQSVGTRPWVIGNFAWTGTDYKGEPSPTNWPSINSHFGVVDIAGFPKDSAGYYRAWWLKDPTHISTLPSSWNFPTGTVLKEVVVFAMAASAELLVNGTSLGAKNISAYGVATWGSVAAGPGSLTARSFDASGAVLASRTVFTTGPPAALRVTCDAGSDAIAADGADVALVRVEVVDASGAVVPDASPLLTFAVTSPGGALVGLANGDPNDHTPDKVGDPALPYGGVWARAAFNGLARAIVQSTTTPSNIVLSVTAPGLAPGTVTIVSS